MGKAARLKNERSIPKVKPMDPTLMKAYMKGREVGLGIGSKEQQEADNKLLVELLRDIENIPGIGEKTAWKVREHFLKQFEEMRK